MQQNDDPELSRVAQELYNMFGQSSQAAQGAWAMKSKPEDRHFGAAYIGCSGVTGALISVAMILAERDASIYNLQATRDKSHEELQALAWKLVSPETLMFASLVSVRMVEHADQNTTDMSFGPTVFWAALQDWQKLFPEKDPAKFIDNQLLDAARKAGVMAERPFAEFLQKRINSDSSGSLN